VKFATYVRDDVDLCELRFFELEEGERFKHKTSRRGSNIPHYVGEKFTAMTGEGSFQ